MGQPRLVAPCTEIAISHWGVSVATGFAALSSLGIATYLGVGFVGLLSVSIILLELGHARRRGRAPGAIEVGERGVLLEWGKRRWHIAHEALVDAVRVGKHGLSLRTTSGNAVSVTVANPLHRDALLAALARGPHARVFVTPLVGTRLYRSAAAMLVFAILVPPVHLRIFGPLVVALALAALVLSCAARFSFGSISVGRDGLLVQGLLSRRFVPYEVLECASVVDGRLLLRAGGARIALAIAHPHADVRTLAARRTTSVLERIRREHQRYSRWDRAPGRAELFARNGRSREAWRQSVRQRFTAATYRGAGADIDDVMRVLENPTLDEELRVGAALALADVPDRAIIRRARVAVETCANPETRARLDEALSAREAHAA